MSDPSDFAQDTEFQKLLSRRSDVDLTLAALELARDADPTLSFEPTLDWIEARAHELGGPLARAQDDRALLDIFGNCLAGRHGIYGDAESYQHAESSYLNRVIIRRRGIPISLSLLYMAIANKAGIELRGVAAPAHFLIRYEGMDGPLFSDPFGQGQVLTLTECIERVTQAANLPYHAAAAVLEPAEPRAIMVRMLNNLKTLHVQQEQWRAAWPVQRRLAALLPTSYGEQRDLAIVTLRAGQPGQSIDLLQACLSRCPENERETLDQSLAEAHRQLSRWN